MNIDIETIKEYYQRIRMTPEEKSRARNNLIAAMRESRAPSQRITYSQVSWYTMLTHTRVFQTALVIMLVILPVGGFAFAAERALPTDAFLYYVKVEVKEEIQGLLLKSAEDRAEFQQRRIEKRVLETAKLVAKGKLTPEHSATIKENIQNHSERAQVEVAKIEEPEIAYDSSDKLATSLEASHEALKEIQDDAPVRDDLKLLVDATEEQVIISTKDKEDREKVAVAQKSIATIAMVEKKKREVERQLAKLASAAAFDDFVRYEEVPQAEKVDETIAATLPKASTVATTTHSLVATVFNEEDVIQNATGTEVIDLPEATETPASDIVVETEASSLALEQEENGIIAEASTTKALSSVEDTGTDVDAPEENVVTTSLAKELTKPAVMSRANDTFIFVSDLYDQAQVKLGQNDLNAALELLREAYRKAEKEILLLEVKEKIIEGDKKSSSEVLNNLEQEASIDSSEIVDDTEDVGVL